MIMLTSERFAEEAAKEFEIEVDEEAREQISVASRREEQIARVNPLTEGARSLLKEAAASRSGIIVRSQTLAGLAIAVNEGKAFLEHGASAREVARWEAALDQLVSEGLVQDKKGQGQVFFVTHRGYQLAEGNDNH